jgi:hypothetical protein
MTNYLNCNEKKCKKAWIEYNGDPDHEDTKNGDVSDLILTHCEIEGCHNIYWKGKNGSTCQWCALEVCEHCSMTNIVWDDCGEESFCVKCDKKIRKDN